MDRHSLPGTILLLCLLGLFSPLLAQLPTGTEFVVPLPSIMTHNERNDPSIRFSVEVMCSRESIVSVRWANVPANNPLGYLVRETIVQAGTRVVLIQPTMFQLFQIVQSDHRDSALLPNSRAFVVTSNHPVTVQATFDKGYRSETYMVPPTSSFDLDYTVLTYNGHGAGTGRTGFIVMAREDNTVLRINPDADVLWGSVANRPYNITLNRHQVYQALSATGGGGTQNDMTGTTIRSTKPIGVISFGSSSVPRIEPPPPPTPPSPPPPPPADAQFDAKTIIDPQLPDSLGGTLFYTAPFARAKISYVRFITMAPSVSVEVNGRRLDSFPNRGSIFDVPIVGPTRITSTGKMIGVQLAVSNDTLKMDTTIVREDLPDTTVRIPYGDPMMAYLPPVSQFKTAVQWAAPNLPERPYKRGAAPYIFYWRHYALITAPASASASVRIDGLPVNFTMTHVDGEYVSAVVPVSVRQHVVEAEAPISVLAYGFTWNDSYGMATGEALRSAAIPSLDSIGLLSCDVEFDTTFVIRNRGNNAFRIDSIRASGIGIRTLAPASFPREVAAGDSAFITVVFRMTQAGSYQGTLGIYTDANNRRTFEIPVRAERDSAQLQYLPTVDFARLKSGETQRDTTIIIANTGSRAVTIRSIGFDRPGYRLMSPTLPLTIAAGGTESIRVRFMPIEDGSYESTLRIVGTPCLDAQEITLLGYKGSGASLLLRRSIEYPSYDCVQIAPGFVDSVVVIRNIGDEPAEVLDGVIGGADAAEFTLLDAAQGRTILPGDSIVLRVRYTPGGYGTRTAQLTITTNASNARSVAIALRARRDTAMVSPSVRLIDFGSVLSCGVQRDTVVMLRNDGTVSDTLEVTSSDAAFSAGTGERLIIHPGGELPVTVRFAPDGNGEFSGVVVIAGSPCGLREEVQVTGRRVAPQLTASPALLRFDPPLYSCEGGRSAEIVLRNDGVVSDTIFSGSIAGSGLFTLEMAGDTIILAPGGETTVRVLFTPDATSGGGTFLGAANFVWGPCSGSSTIDLSAEIIDPIVQLSSASLDIGDVQMLAGGRGSVLLSNESTADRQVTGIEITPAGSFRVVSPTSFPAVIPAGGTLEVEVEYLAEQPGASAAVARVEIAGPCPEQKQIALAARGVGDALIAVTVGVGVPSLSGFIDDRVQVPVSITGTANLALVDARTVRFWVSYGTRLLAPLGVTTAVPGMTARIIRDSIAGSRRFTLVELSGGVLPVAGEIARLELLVLLGDETTTALEVEVVDVELGNPAGRLSINGSTNGVFTSLGYCETGGDRLVRRGGALKLSSGRPNPFKGETELEVELGSRRRVELRVMDGRGVEVARLLDGELEGGVHRVMFAAGDLPSGMYVCELRSQGEVRREVVILLK